MITREEVSEKASKISKEKATPETLLLSLILHVLLDIRDQNDIMLDQQSDGYRNGP